MTNMNRTFVTTGLVLALAAPAAAQGPDRTRDFERQIEAHALAIAARVAEALDEAFQRGPRDERRGPEVTEPFSRTVRLGRTGTVDLSNIAGDIVVTGGGGDDVRIDAVKRVRDRDDAAGRSRLQEIAIEVRELGNRVEVRTEYPRDRNDRRESFVSVDFTIALPQNAGVTLKSVSGDVRVTNVRGELRAETVSGNVVATDVPRATLLKSVSGDIQLTNAGSDTSLSGGTVSGDVVIRGLKARTIDVGSVSGNVRLENVEAESATLRSVSGNIDYGSELARNGRYEFTSHSGTVRLMLSGNTGFDVEATTFSGDVRSDYALTLGGTQVDNGGRGGRGRGRGPGNRGIRGSFGDGSARLTLRSFSGDIVITRR